MKAREIPHKDARAIAERLADKPGFVWLDGDGSAQGARSYLGVEPSTWHTARFGDEDPLAVLADLDTHETEHVPRYIGYLSYDAGVTPHAARHPRTALPVVCFGRYDAVVEIDHAQGRVRLVGSEDGIDRLERALSGPPRNHAARAGDVTSEPQATHAQAIEHALEAIARGDVYEVNLARRFEAPFAGDPLALFLAMRDASPVPFGAFLAGPGFAIASRSMERFLAWERRTRTLASRPIKGTIARTTPALDATHAQSLKDDEKERAEHVMIVDLMRNDLGRVAETGSVRMPSLFEVEPYAKLSHLVSTVTCTTREDVGLLDVLRATFPPGSVTGAPKVAAVRIIEALERSARGPYTGAIGYVAANGDVSFSVAIRTAVVHEGTATYFAGGGIVEASVPDREVAETELKAKVFTEAIARARES